MLEITIATRSELGQRECNEDKVRVGRDGALWLAVLADGAGGHRGGAEAARRAVDHIEAELHEVVPGFSAESLTKAVLSAHAQVQLNQGHAEGFDRMHSTVVALWIDGTCNCALWTHVGDSRLYRARRGTLSLLTVDDSVVQRMVDAGLLTQQQAEVHPQKNQLIAALGIDDEVEPHTAPDPVELEDGDAFLLCSDGWWGSLDESSIVETLADASGPDDWLASMQRRIETRAVPRQDNFSAIGIWVGDPGEGRRAMLSLSGCQPPSAASSFGRRFATMNASDGSAPRAMGKRSPASSRPRKTTKAAAARTTAIPDSDDRRAERLLRVNPA